MMKRLIAIAILVFSQIGTASTDEKIDLEMSASEFKGKNPKILSNITPQEAFARTQAVLEHFNVPKEKVNGQWFSQMGNHFSLSDLRKRLSILDPFQSFAKFLKISNSAVTVYQDFTSQNYADFYFNLSTAPQTPSLKDRILAAQKNPSSLPLKGLKIALDPGHMGGAYWDIETGKYVSDGNNKVSEGVINLQTCLLLKADLEKLGAKVLVTHEGLQPVTKLNVETFDLKPYALQEMRLQTLAPWFQNLLTTAPAGPQLYSAFEQSSSFKSLFSGNMRNLFFDRRADLDARVELMNAFAPDITIFVHHDTGGDTAGPGNSPNMFRAFIPGSFQQAEVSDRNSRLFLLRHWLDQDAWDLSVQLIRATAGQVKSRMGIPAAKDDWEDSVKVEDGVFARNLFVPRKMRNTITAYYEMFYYDRYEEFKALLDTKHPMTIDGKSYPYSDRVRQSADSLREGILDFIRQAR